MEKRSRLGRGLSSLLNSQSANEIEPHAPAADPPTDNQGVTQPEMLHVELSRVQPNPHQPRRIFSEATLGSLAESIKVAGVIQPIIVREVGTHYEVIAGERRYRAAKMAALLTVPVIVRRMEAVEQSQVALIENIHREDLNPIDRARAYREILQTIGLTQAELATRLGEDRSSIGHYLRLLDLPEATQKLVMNGDISIGHAKLLTAIEDSREIDRLAQLVLSQHLSVRNLEALIKQGRVAKAPAASRISTPHLADLELQISRELQMRAEVKQAKKSGRGKLILHYASLDQFDHLIAKLGVKIED